MFNQAFRGLAHEDFIKGLDIYNHIYNPKIHFGRTIPLLQSSGTGKSRMVYEMGYQVCFAFPPCIIYKRNVQVPTLSICFREGEQPDLGWPPNDQPARRFFLKQRDSEFRVRGDGRLPIHWIDRVL
jgi:hypothetical protein